MHKNKKLKRVIFSLEENAWHAISTERLWAEEVAMGRYKLRNSPFYAKNISFEDVVFGRVSATGDIEFSGVSLRAGHSTYRIFSKTPIESKNFREAWAELQNLGCSFEQGTGNIISVDVPARANIYSVYGILEKHEKDGTWDFEEGHCGHALT